MELFKPFTFIPIDRYHALTQGTTLPDYAIGAVMFADISGFTPLTEALLNTYGPRRGAEELTRQLNLVYSRLITDVHAYRGCVIGFSGDAITCWFDGDDGLRATTCGLRMQQTIREFADMTVLVDQAVSLAVKVAVASGPVRRFVVGDPRIQYIDVLAGATLDRMAAAERCANKGEVVLAPRAMAALHERVRCIEWREDGEFGEGFAVVAEVTVPVPQELWPDISTTALSEEQVRRWIIPQVYERLKTVQGQFLAEIRPSVALFLRFSGIDYDHDKDAGKQLDQYICWVQNILARYEGFLLQLTIGDKGSYMYAAFGAPIAHDDDPVRAVAAALDLVVQPPELDYITGVQVGISKGLMRAGAYGSARRQTYGVLGDEVNLAARLMARAQPGQILVSGRIAYSTSHVYHLEPMGLVSVKGKQEPVPVSLVQSRRHSAQQRPHMLFMSPLVGRDRELQVFERTLETVIHGNGQIVRIEGVAGIGKSHLAAAYAGRALQQGLQVVVGACQSISQNIAYAPWRQVFWTLAGLSEQGPSHAPPGGAQASPSELVGQLEAQIMGLNPEWAVRLPLLGDLLGLPIADNATTAAFDPQLRQEALFALAVDLVKVWAHQQPLVLVIEDAHWMDEASLGLTLALSRVVTQMPVLLVLVQRPALHEDEPLLPELYQMEVHHAIDLNELPPDAVTALVTNRLQAAVLPLALALIQAQAQGNPFFVEELVDALCEAGKLLQEPDGSWTLSDGVMQALQDSQCLVKDSDGEWAMAPGASLSAAELGIPDSVHGVVLSRLDRLSEEHKLTLKVASVIGRIFDVDVLAQVHPARPARDVLLNQIRIVEARDFTRLEMPLPRLTYIFKHSVTQEVAYGTLLDSQRQELHCAVGDALEELQPEAVEQMAYHYSHSGVRDKTLFYLDKAARKTQREYANETALAYYIQALALEERWEWRQGQVEILHTLGRRDEQQAALQELEGDSNTPVFVAAYLWGEYYEATGDYALAHTAVERALADCYERGDVLGQIRCLTRLGWIDYRQGDYEGASIRYTEALGLLKDGSALSDDASQVMVEALNGLGSVYQQQTTFDQAQACFEQALQVSRTTNHRKGEADALNNLGIIYRYQRNFADALARYQRALDIQRMIGDRSGEGASLGNMAQVIQETGDYGRASEFFTASLAIQQAIGNRWNEINDWNDLGVLYQELGEPDRAQECLEQGLRLGEEIGDEAGQAYIMVNLGLVAHDRGNLDEARKILADGLSLAQEQDDTYLVSLYHSYLAVVYLGMHALQDAITHAQTALALRRGLDLRLDTTYNLTTLAQAYMLDGDMESAVKYAHDALHILGECGGEGPEFPQRDYFLCAQVLDTSGDREASRQAMQAAYDLVMERATKITDPVLRQSFLERVAINRQVVQAGGAL